MIKFNIREIMNSKNYATALVLGLFLLLLPMISTAQLSRSQVPKALVETKSNTPNHMEFKGDKLIVKTDPGKMSGQQYMVEYKITWNGNKFNLVSLKEVATEIDENGEEIITTAKNADFFGYSYLKNWSFTKDANGNYVLTSASTRDYRWIYKAE